jgi:phosphate/sulfate permease
MTEQESKPSPRLSLQIGLSVGLLIAGVCGMWGMYSQIFSALFFIGIVGLIISFVIFARANMPRWEIAPRKEENPDKFPDLNKSFTYGAEKPPKPRSPTPSEANRFPNWITHVGGHSVFQHAQKAVKAAEQPLDTTKPLPVDLGFLVYRGDSKPNIHRTLAIPYETDYIQPYLQLHVPKVPIFSGVLGRVKFEILDSVKKVVFTHEQEYTLREGLNLITPPARFPAQNAHYGYHEWELCIRLGDTLIARQPLEWGEMKTPEIAEGLGEDGEISDALRKLVAEQKIESLSLDELLSSQSENQQEEQR